MERQARLSLLEDSNDPAERDACRIISKFLKYLLGPARDYILDLDEVDRNPPEKTDDRYMEFDSESKPPQGPNGSAPE